MYCSLVTLVNRDMDCHMTWRSFGPGFNAVAMLALMLQGRIETSGGYLCATLAADNDM